ncbi:MAG: DUF3570 domain-containing protein [Gammaproteobacteria bacterium]|nr:DUF3570 domain-containing protein [Gammaproteobacteria bacterium]
MSYSSSKKIRDSLSLACCSLLQVAPEASATPIGDVSIDSAVLIYSESDNRVSLIEPVVKLKTELKEDQFLSVQLVFDALTGASPNGAQASNVAQTFTSPSGVGEYTTPANELPLDSTFRDSRFAMAATLESPIDRLQKNIYSLSLSAEHDWNSLSAGYTYSKDLNLRNTTVMTGASLTYDAISPVGGAPVEFAQMLAPGFSQPKDGKKDRNTIDFIAGISQVLNRSTITQLNYSVSQSDGYHNDPYKILSLLDDTSALPTGNYLYEKRPDNRQRHIIYWKTAHHFTDDVINIAYRYYQDDWGIVSHTADLKYRYELSAKSFLQPHIRFYSQTAADFYRHSLLASEASALPDFASADFRLGEFNSTTIGLKYGRELGNNRHFSSRLEVMQQSGNSQPADAFGEQLNQDLYPDLTAIILQFSYSFIW